MTLRKIKKAQTVKGSLFRRAPIKRLIRSVIDSSFSEVGDTEEGIKNYSAGSNAVTHIQMALEGYMTELMTKTNMLMIHSKRLTVTDRDLQLTAQMSDDKFRMVEVDELFSRLSSTPYKTRNNVVVKSGEE